MTPTVWLAIASLLCGILGGVISGLLMAIRMSWHFDVRLSNVETNLTGENGVTARVGRIESKLDTMLIRMGGTYHG